MGAGPLVSERAKPAACCLIIPQAYYPLLLFTEPLMNDKNSCFFIKNVNATRIKTAGTDDESKEIKRRSSFIFQNRSHKQTEEDIERAVTQVPAVTSAKTQERAVCEALQIPV